MTSVYGSLSPPECSVVRDRAMRHEQIRPRLSADVHCVHGGVLDARQAFTSHGNHKGNADIERMMRTLKEECL